VRLSSCNACVEVDEARGKVRRPLLTIFVSAVVYSIALVLKFHLNISGAAEVAAFGLAYVVPCVEALRKGLSELSSKNPFNEYLLVVVATLGAFAIASYPEAAGVMLFFMVGEHLQELAVRRSRRSIKALLSLKADHANLKTEKGVVKVRPEEVRVGDLILVRPGERIPLDGEVIKGTSVVDASALTGESTPRLVRSGDHVLSGMVNLSGLLLIKVKRRYSESTVARILNLVERGSARKAKAEVLIRRFARYYTPAILVLAASLAFLPPILFGASLKVWAYRSLVVLVTSCPCALVISIPLTYFAGLGKCAKEGVLVKGSNFLDLLARLKVVALDKTGTLTKGAFRVSKVVAVNGFEDEDVLRYAALAEAHSNHPIALAIRNAYPIDETIDLIEEYEEEPGYGVKAKVGGVEVLVGNERLMLREGTKSYQRGKEGSLVHVAIGGVYAGYVAVSDEVREGARGVVKGLKELGVGKVIMLTGDREDVAKRVAEELGVDEYYFELLPWDKVELIEDICASEGGGPVAFVGDGVNDAPVIARADVGIAMGGLGSDAAIEAADVVIMGDELTSLLKAVKVAKKTRSAVLQNVGLALGLKLLLLGLGALGEAAMWEAAFADVGAALITILNSVRVLK